MLWKAYFLKFQKIMIFDCKNISLQNINFIQNEKLFERQIKRITYESNNSSNIYRYEYNLYVKK